MNVNKDTMIIKSKATKFLMRRVCLILGPIWILLSIFSFFELFYISFELPLSIFMFFTGIFLFIFGLQSLFSYLVIYENGIVIRRPYLINFLKKKYISFDIILDVKVVKEFHNNISKKFLVIYLQNQEKFRLNLGWVINYEEIKNHVLNKISFKNDLIIVEPTNKHKNLKYDYRNLESYKYIEQILDKDEKILWQRSEQINLLSYFPIIFYFILLSFILIIIIILFFTSVESMINPFLILIPTIIIDLFLIILAIYNYIILNNRLDLPFNIIKRYEEFEILTDKQYIRRNYYLNFKKDLSIYSENAFKKKGDIIIFNLERIEGIVVDHISSQIFFLVEEEVNIREIHDIITNTNFFIDLNKDEINEINILLEDLIKIISLEKHTQNSNFTRYHRKR